MNSKCTGMLEGKVAVITGAGVGIGAGTARRMAAEGAAVVLMARRKERLDKVAGDIRRDGGKVATMVGDVSVAEDCEKLMKLAADTFGRLDILVNNAGIPDFHLTTTKADDDIWFKNIASNQTGVFYCSRAALPYMEKQSSGVIVIISSICGVYGNGGVSSSATKAAAIGISKNIALQYSGTGIRCNTLCPGPTLLDPVYDEALAHDPHNEPKDPEFMATTTRHMDITMKPAEAVDQVNIIMFLASDESKAINGQVIVADGGMCM